jgi:Flp pilus assembly protein TadB
MGNPASEPFTSIEQTQPKNRGSQLLVIAAILVTVLGGLLTIAVDQVIGLVLLVGGFVSLIALTAWAIRNWDWER